MTECKSNKCPHCGEEMIYIVDEGIPNYYWCENCGYEMDDVDEEMKVEEAKQYLLNRYLVVGSPVNPPKEECEKHNEVIDLAIEALEKQIPKSWIRNEYYDGECTWECPCCKEEYVLISGGVKENGYNYCPNCGQKLDWNDFE